MTPDPNKTPLGALSTSETWDLVIRPKTGWFNLHLSDLWRYRDLTMLFVWRDFVAQYKQTVLGPLWYLLQPLLTTLLFTLIFGRIAKLPTDNLPPMLFYMGGITCWNYFSECITRTSSTFISNADIFGKVYFPRLTVPVSAVISNLIKFAIQLTLFLGFMGFFWLKGYHIRPNAAIALVPALLVLMAALGLGCGIIVSSLTTKYRDLQILVGFGVQLAMYATPVIYPISIFPKAVRWMALINPMTPIIEAFRYALLGQGMFSPAYLAISTAIIALILFIGIILFNHVERTFMDTV